VITILQGDCRERLREMAAGSVHCVVTSPPYWGLRNYGLPPLEWGGDASCEHRWGDSLSSQTDHVDKRRWNHTVNGRGEVQPEEKQVGEVRPISQGQFCRLCGCWRGSLGLEPSPSDYVSHLVEVMREVRRVLRDDGTVWMNLGDSYFGDSPTRKRSSEAFSDTWDKSQTASRGGLRRSAASIDGLKPKDLIGIPWRVVFALQEDGWYLRSAIVWAKGLSFCPTYSGSVMPESVTDRPTSAYEYVFLLSKSARYFYDADAVREANTTYNTNIPGRGGNVKGTDGISQPDWLNTPSHYVPAGRNLRNVFAIPDDANPWELFTNWLAKKLCDDDPDRYAALIREYLNGQDELTNTWVINPAGFPGAHFATFAPALVEPCIRAGSSERGVCPQCGAGWVRVVERAGGNWEERKAAGAPMRYGMNNNKGEAITNYGGSDAHTLGWRPGCECSGLTIIGDQPTKPSRRKGSTDLDYEADLAIWWVRLDKWWQHWNELKPLYDAEPTIPATVLDPFGGSGTTGLVARQLGRDAILIELSEEYCEMARRRLDGTEEIETVDHNGDEVIAEQARLFSSVEIQ
jgi:DNA modification methylase